MEEGRNTLGVENVRDSKTRKENALQCKNSKEEWLNKRMRQTGATPGK